MVKVEYTSNHKTVEKNVSNDDVMNLLSSIDTCIDGDLRDNGFHGFDFQLTDGKFLSIGIWSEMMYGDCEHNIYICVSDEDPRIWKKEQDLKYQQLRENGC
jgi:hypothetical protein